MPASRILVVGQSKFASTTFVEANVDVLAS